MTVLTWIAAAASVVATGVSIVWFLRFRHNIIQVNHYREEYFSLVDELVQNPEVDEKIKHILIECAHLISNRKFAEKVYSRMQEDFSGIDQPEDYIQSMEELSTKTQNDLKTAIMIFLVGLSYNSWEHGVDMRRLIIRKLVARPEYDLQVVYSLAPVDQNTAPNAPLQPA